MYEITVGSGFSSGHYMRNYRGKCDNPHGHNYKVRLTLGGREFDPSRSVAGFQDAQAGDAAGDRPHRPPDAQ